MTLFFFVLFFPYSIHTHTLRVLQQTSHYDLLQQEDIQHPQHQRHQQHFNGVFLQRKEILCLTKHEAQKAKEIPPFNRDLRFYIGVIVCSFFIQGDGRERKELAELKSQLFSPHID